MDSVEGGSFICWEVFLAPEALTRALKAQASNGVWGRALPPPPPPGNLANLCSLKCHFLDFDVISEVACIFLEH